MLPRFISNQSEMKQLKTYYRKLKSLKKRYDNLNSAILAAKEERTRLVNIKNINTNETSVNRKDSTAESQ